MVSGEEPVILKDTVSFEAVLDEACDKLQDRQTRNSILRLHQMEDRLSALEDELDVFLLQKDTPGAG
jgi:hypothetical protein